MYRRPRGPPWTMAPVAPYAPPSCATRSPPALAQPGIRPGLDRGLDLDLRLADHAASRCRSWPSSCSARGRSRSPSCAASSSWRRSSSGWSPGAWVDRLRRRPVLIWADLGRAVLLGLDPAGLRARACSRSRTCWSCPGSTAILTTFFDAADTAYLPTIVERDRLVDANAALSASGSVSEFAAFGITGFLVQLLTAPIAIAIDSVTYVISALLLATIRQPEPPPPPRADREPVLAEIREGLRLVRHDPVLRAFAFAQMSLAAMFGVFGAVWFLFVLEDLHISAAVLGVIAAVGGVSGFVGAVVASPRRAPLGDRTGRDRGAPADRARRMPSSPSRRLHCRSSPSAVWSWHRSSATRRRPSTTSPRCRSARRSSTIERWGGSPRRSMSRPSSPSSCRRSWPGVLGEVIGVRTTAWLAPVGGLVGAAVLWSSPVRHLLVLPAAVGAREIDPIEAARAAHLEQPPGA